MPEDYKKYVAPEDLEEKIDRLESVIRKIKTWANAYYSEDFPEPSKEDFIKADKVLKENGLSLSTISASNMRHVISGVKEYCVGY